MPAPALLDLARRACIRNIRDIETVGDLPYDVVRPILLKLENPTQLRNLEANSPQIRGVDAELWKAFIKRDIDNWRQKYVEPSNPESWSKVYFKLLDENKKEEAEDMAVLKQQLAQCEKEKMSNTSTQVESRFLPKLPGARSLAAIQAEERTRPGPLRLTSGSRTKMVSSKFIMDKARREAAQNSLFRNKNNALALPTHLLNSRSSKVKNVPQGVLEVYQRQQRPQTKHAQVEKLEATGTSGGQDQSKEFIAREQRLRDLASGRKPTPMKIQETCSSHAPQKTTGNESRTATNSPTTAQKPATIERRAIIVRKSPNKTALLKRNQAPESSNSSSKKRKLDDEDLISPPPKKSTGRPGTPVPPSSTTTVAQVHTENPSEPLVKSVEGSRSLSPPAHPFSPTEALDRRRSPLSLGKSPQPSLGFIRKKQKREVNIFMTPKRPERKV